MENATVADRELLRLHRRACTDFAARLRLPAWEHLKLELAQPLAPLTVADLLLQVADGNLKTAAAVCGQPEPAKLAAAPSEVIEVTVESIRTVLTVLAGTGLAGTGQAGTGLADTGQAGLAPAMRDLLWNRVAELTVLGYDMQQAIQAGAGLDEQLVDQLLAAGRLNLDGDSKDGALHVWPYLPALPTDHGTEPMTRLLALTGRPPGAWLTQTGAQTGAQTSAQTSAQTWSGPAEDSCATGQC